MQEIYTGNSDGNIIAWENNPVRNYINNSMMSVERHELTEFDKKILRFIAVDIDKDTGKVHTTFQWSEIAKAIVEETAIYTKAKKVPHINPIKNIKAGRAARRRTKALKEFYLEHIQSGKYRAELEEACKNADSEKVYDTIVSYLKLLKSDLERRMG